MGDVIRVKIDGLNSSKIINSLIDENVLLENIKYKTHSVIFELKSGEELKLKNICRRYHKKYCVISRNGLLNFIKRLRFYIGFLLAVSLSCFVSFWSSLYVYKINIIVDGNAKFNLGAIENLLTEQGLVVGVKKSKLNLNEIQNLIIKSQKDVAGCSIIGNGGVLDVVIYPAVLKEELKTEDIYSLYNAVIVDVEVYAGEANVKVGDLVQVGDLLIKNNNGASGKIKGKIYYSDYIIYNENQLVKQKTGMVLEKINIGFINNNTYKAAKNIDFTNYIEENCVFCVSRNAFLPIYLIKTKYEEFIYKEQIVPFVDVENNLKDELYKSVLLKIPNGCGLTNVTYSVVSENNLTRLDCFIECEIDLI